MADNYISSGDTMDITVPAGGVTSGDAIPLPAQGTTMGCVVIAKETAAAGAVIACAARGIHRVTKATGATWSEGEKLYYNASDEFTPTATSNGYAGVAAADAASGDTTGLCNINHGAS